MKHIDSINSWKQDIIQFHLNQSFGELNVHPDMDNLLKKYHLFPNEALYVIDCKQAQLEALSKNFNKIIGIDKPKSHDISLLYDHVDECNVSALHHWVMTNLRTAFHQSTGVQTEKDVFKCIYKTYDERVLLKCTTGLIYDSAGAMRYTLGKLVDLTGLTDFQHFGYKFDGPNKEIFYKMYKAGAELKCTLTKREKEILALLSEGFTSQIIASKLYISVHTVDTHRRNIIEKMGTTTSMDAYRKSKNLGWL